MAVVPSLFRRVDVVSLVLPLSVVPAVVSVDDVPLEDVSWVSQAL